ncbi:CDP-alcohol phosphatidyltransferase family protein [Parabacteroides pacaensis]|uniref:CDP-alcohol phosphatidyltransferase family protein n=1 Tax=Parabacteroides pacaensis TaxID=2086575 RepID=UPI000D0E60BF|nr:CDP-alcohol phosphatidyltransferase family protein [Parabacteroides pacaensis]
MSDIKSEYESSLKSIETENKIDRMFYRPLGFIIAKSLKNTGITPNMVTILSIFVGLGAGILFYFPHHLTFTIYGILCLICANILDCVDGQLARLTGIKSEIGRILDGFAGDLWFFCIYVSFALRLIHEYPQWWYLFFPLAILSGFSHQAQAAMTDYYKTLHLFFVSKETGKEFESYEQVKARCEKMKPGIVKFFTCGYATYTRNQEKFTPKLQQLLQALKNKYHDNIPENLRIAFRKKSRYLMRYIDFLTFNGRTIVLFIIVLTGQVWAYFAYEIIILNGILIYVVKRHEKMCANFLKKMNE